MTALIIIIIVVIAVILIVVTILLVRRHNKRCVSGTPKKEKKPSLLVLDKGQRTENILVRRLMSLNIEGSYIVEDLIIPTRYGGSSEIDAIMVTRKGVYVFETKNWNGTIIGNETDDKITQIDVSGEYRHEYKNPVKQNMGHIYALMNILKRRKEVFIPVVVFITDDLRFKSESMPVIRMRELDTYIKGIESSRANFLSDKEIERISLVLKDHKDNPRVTKKEHITNVKSTHQDA